MAVPTKRICLWSGPRNVSTALMYSFAQRSDTKVYDEPLYAHYLASTLAQEYHPGASEILASMENNGEKVVEMMLGEYDTPVVFFKQMTHHLIELDRSFLKECINIILTRSPREMLVSFAKVIPNPTMLDVGYRSHIELVKYLRSVGQNPIVMDSKEILLNPREALLKLCQKIGIPFQKSMLSWEAGSIPEDGVWAKYWYANVHKSTGFQPYVHKEVEVPNHLKSLLEECEKIYSDLISQGC